MSAEQVEATPESWADVHRTPALNKALAEVQKALPDIKAGQTANAGSYSYKYADLADINPKILPLLGKNGLSWTTRPTMHFDRFVLLYELRHESGEMIDGLYPLSDRGTPQDLGKAITYARRYALCAVTGIAAGGDDDDGQSASQAAQQQPAKTAQRRPPQQRDTHTERSQYGPNAPRTDDQSNKIFAMLGELGIDYKAEVGRDEVLSMFSQWLRKDLASTRDLTKRDARQVIDNLQGMLDGGPMFINAETGEVPMAEPPPEEG